MLKKPTLRKFNNGLTVVVILLGVYITLTPWWPRINLWAQQQVDDSNGYVYRGSLSANQAPDDKLAPPPNDNTLVIPAINIDERVLEGQGIGVIGNGGVWRRPNTSTPDQGGNTVIVGHRFTYSGDSTFFNLDQVSIGERLGVWWNKQEYVYEVTDVTIVPANAIEIERSTEDPTLTLYTCTPVWTAKDRLVIRAKLINTDVLEL